MNYIKEVAKLLGYEIGEEFNVIYNTGEYSKYNPFKFTETSLVDKDGDNSNDYISNLLTGHHTIEKIPFVPKLNETYWSYNSCIRADDWIWLDSSFDYRNKMLGLVFRTKEEAENYLPTFKERLKEQGWLEK